MARPIWLIHCKRLGPLCVVGKRVSIARPHIFGAQTAHSDLYLKELVECSKRILS